MEPPLTYHQILAEQYEENAKTALVQQPRRYEEDEYDVDAQVGTHGVELENQSAFRKFAGNRNLETDIVKTRDFDDKSKLSVRYNKDVRTSVVNVDTRYRSYYVGDAAVNAGRTANPNYISPILSTASSTSTHFVFRLSRLIRNAMSVKLSSIEIPNKFSNISTFRGNRSFGLRLNGVANSSFSGITLNKSVLYVTGSTTGLSPGMSVTFYNFTSFGNIVAGTTYFILTVSSESFTITDTLIDPSLPTPLQFQAGTDNGYNTASMDAFQTVIVPEGYYNDFNIHERVATAMNALTISGKGTFSTSMDSMMRTTINTTNTSGYTYDFHFGNPTTPQVYPTLLYTLGFNQLKSASISGVGLTTYFNKTQLLSEDQMNTNVDTYFYLAINDWNNVEHQSRNDAYFSVFAKIPVTVDKGKLIYDNDSTNSTTKIFRFLQPTNIQTLEIQLLDGFGNELQMDSAVNYSMTLEIEEVLSHSLYEKLREL
jgi:hypothetical protein